MISPRDLAIGAEVAMIVAGVWFARFARRVKDQIEAAEKHEPKSPAKTKP